MATLHMEVEVCHDAVTSLNNNSQTLEQIFTNLNNVVNGLQSGAWVGNSANEFFGLYSDWAGKFKAQADQITTLASRLQTEVTEWENMAAKLG